MTFPEANSSPPKMDDWKTSSCPFGAFGLFSTANCYFQPLYGMARPAVLEDGFGGGGWKHLRLTRGIRDDPAGTKMAGKTTDFFSVAIGPISSGWTVEI